MKDPASSSPPSSSASGDDILSILSDEQNRRIISILYDKELNIQQISNLLKLSQSTAYRRVRVLEDFKIVKKTKIVRTMAGLDEAYYRSWISEIVITFKEGKISYRLERIKLEDKIMRLWQHFSD
jgi:DNA-binding transcriptional ArsR family regulator